VNRGLGSPCAPRARGVCPISKPRDLCRQAFPNMRKNQNYKGDTLSARKSNPVAVIELQTVIKPQSSQDLDGPCTSQSEKLTIQGKKRSKHAPRRRPVAHEKTPVTKLPNAIAFLECASVGTYARKRSPSKSQARRTSDVRMLVPPRMFPSIPSV